MASISATCVISFSSSLKQSIHAAQIPGRTSSLRMVSVGLTRTVFTNSRASRFRVSCAAKPETVDKVCQVVRSQLALPPDSELTPDSKFSALGADSLDTVEIVMTLEEEFGISVEEDSSQNITTVQEAADMIEKLIQKKSETSS